MVTTDAEGRVLAVNTADGSLPLPSRVYVQAAERWVKLLRRRPAGASVRGSDAERLVDGWRDEARTFTNDRLGRDRSPRRCTRTTGRWATRPSTSRATRRR